MIGRYARAVAPIPLWVPALQQVPAAPATPSDSVVVESPLPGGIATVTRFLLNSVPQWVQIGGLVLVVVVGALVLWYLFRRRQPIRGWIASRSRATTWALAAGTMAMAAAVVGMGSATWNYTQHSNAFCTGCHVMNPAFQKFSSGGNKHADLSCHNCHQQSVFASARQLYLWVAERPEKIGMHSKVPNRVCETCHVTGDTARWQRVASTAGHRVHLESDSSALKDVQCVTCHGAEVHRFRPVSNTCGQSGCHEQSETKIVLGKMATQTIRHCTTCHAFTAEVPALATRDSAAGTLVPGKPECLGCHEMRKVLGDFDVTKDPHGGKCGTCHNPHTQEAPREAAKTCTTSGCHANWRDEPFHIGVNHAKVGTRCLTCHLPHQAKVDASDCAGCHANVRSRGNLRPPVPFDTTRALRRVSEMLPAPPVQTVRPGFAPHARPAGPSADDPSAEDVSNDALQARDDGVVSATRRDVPGVHATWPPPGAADTFPHTRHAKLACLVCHQTGTARSRLTFERPRGCMICHHQAPESARCAACHQPAEVAAAKPVTVTVAVAGHQPVSRPVDFLHARHASQTCVGCHTTPVSLAPSPAIAQCKNCHSEHHAADRTCSTCHAAADPKAAHKSPEVAHQRCDACHTATTVAQLTPTRTFCSTCHTQQATTHYPQKECTPCHFLAEPGAYRSTLTGRPR